MKNTKTWSGTCVVAIFLLSVPSFRNSADAEENRNKVKPGEFIIDHPTLINLGFEWFIQGDDNRNAQVEVSYRRQGETLRKQGLPLLRLQGERIYQNRRLSQYVCRQHSRSGAGYGV